MLFNSIDFALFLPIVFLLYWFIFYRHLKAQNALIAISSYVFYGWWDWRFLSLIIFSTIVDYFIGIKLYKTKLKKKRQLLLWASILVNLGFLGFFKYFNFFIDNFVDAFSFLGYQIPKTSLNIILPVGISFYTFQTLSYTIDVYRKKIKPTKDYIAFTAFVSFFPQLVAGPIERASNLLPQFYNKRKFDYQEAVLGMRQILWGFFKKVVIADNCATLANEIFNNSDIYGGPVLILGALMFTFQIYGDFSGYSDIAIGTARLFGFRLMKNFAFPYFSRDIAEFWRRWHISLSTWFRDYLYIPLGGSRVGKLKKVRNTFIIFIVSGFWHGANWTFIVWGALNAIYFLPLLLTNKNRVHLGSIASNRFLPNFKESWAILSTFSLTVLTWVFFRAESIGHAVQYLIDLTTGLFTYFNYHATFNLMMDFNNISLLMLIPFFIVIEWLGRDDEFAIEKFGTNINYLFRWSFYCLLIFLIGTFMPTEESPFIYFQF